MLSNNQKTELAILARRAFEKCVIVGGPDDGIDSDGWRRREVANACGKNGLRCCGQNDYNPVKGHFLHLLGEDGRAMKVYVRAATDKKRTAEVILLRALAEFGYRQDYAEGISRKKFSCTVSEASPDQVWKLIYIVRRNGQFKRKKLREVPV